MKQRDICEDKSLLTLIKQGVSKEAIDSSHFDNDLMSELTLSLGVPNEPPEDKGEVAYKMMILFGFACLLPWSAILNCLDFFAHNE